jgi:hypothetical protein
MMTADDLTTETGARDTDGLSTAEVSSVTGLSFRQLDNWVTLGVIHPDLWRGKAGSGSRRRWSFHQVRVLMLLAVLRSLGAATSTLRGVVVNIAELEEAEGPVNVWGRSVLVTEDGRIMASTACSEHGYLVRLNRCRDLNMDVRRLASLAS